MCKVEKMTNRKSKIANPKYLHRTPSGVPVSEIPLIVLTNDDGIESPGLLALAREITKIGEVLIVAPRHQQTSMGRAFAGSERTVPFDYQVDGKRVPAFAVYATPAICVRNAVLAFADRAPDLIITGVNYGENIGNGVTISGTVCAAIEGASLGFPALAVSVETPPEFHRTHSDTVDFAVSAQWARKFAQMILKRGLPRGADVVNLNVPSDAKLSTTWRWTRVSRNPYFRSKVVDTPRGKRIRGYEVNLDQETPERDSDVRVMVLDRQVSVSLITFDLTARVSKQVLERWGK
jgi:5'-nucleotidase